MRRNQGDHLKWDEVKAGIIEFIISSDGPVLEPEIREFLVREYEIKDIGNMKKHLRDLQYRPYSCINKIPGKPGFANSWDIIHVKNLKNVRIHFPEIRLNTYDKSLNIISDHLGFNQGTPYADEYRRQLSISVSFFDMCLKGEVETLYTKPDEICKLSKGATYWRSLLPTINPIHKLYIKFMEGILKNSNIGWMLIMNI